MTGVLAEVRAGYRYPDDWNRLCHEYGVEDYVEPEPTRMERVTRALDWGTCALRERAAALLAPR